MSNIPSDIDCNAIQSESVTASPVSKNSDDKELSWSNVEDTDDDTSLSSVAVEEHLAEPVVEPVAEPVVEPVAPVEPVSPVDSVEKCEEAEKPAEKPVEVQKFTVPPLTVEDDTSDLESDDDMPALVSSSNEESSDESNEESSDESNDESSDEETTDDSDESDDEMPELVSDDDDIVHMMIRDTNCLRCSSAIQTLLSHDHDYLNGIEEECTTLRPKNEFPSIITYILWLFIALHALNLVSTYCGHPSC